MVSERGAQALEGLSIALGLCGANFLCGLVLRGLRGLDIGGGDVVEVSPPFDPSGNTALVGATMMYEILCILAEATAKRKG